MDFVVLLKFRSSVSAAEADAALGRRGGGSIRGRRADSRVLAALLGGAGRDHLVRGQRREDHGDRLRVERRVRHRLLSAVSADEGLRIGSEVFAPPATHAAASLRYQKAGPWGLQVPPPCGRVAPRRYAVSLWMHAHAKCHSRRIEGLRIGSELLARTACHGLAKTVRFRDSSG